MTAPAALVLHGTVVDPGRRAPLPRTRVELAHGRIVSLQPGASDAGADMVLRDGCIAPGLIDLQINGAGGVDFTAAADPAAALHHVAQLLLRHGVTAFCATLVSAPEALIRDRLAAYRPRHLGAGAECLGLHVEGPFISPGSPGVHDRALLRRPSVPEIDRWLRVGRPAIVTLAPELPGALRAIARLCQAGVVVSLGHSRADLAASRAGLDAGATMGTHLFNAMPPLHHRAPGLVGALLDSRATIGLIADGSHVDPVAVRLAVRAAGPERIMLVSDAVSIASGDCHTATLGDQAIMSDGVVGRRADGTIAGGAVLLDSGVRNARAWLPWLTDGQVIRMASWTPARALGAALAARKGRVAVGYDADLVVFDSAWYPTATIVGGALAWRRP